MAYNYEWPYGDPNRYNSDWEINKVKELDARVTAAEQKIADFEANMRADWEAYQAQIDSRIDDFTESMATEWNNYKTEMNQSWTSYQNSLNAQWAQYRADTTADITTWKNNTIDDLAAWKRQAESDISDWEDATSAALDADFASYRQSTEAAIAAWESSTSANLTKLMDDYKALLNGEWAQYKTDTDTDIAAFKADVNGSLAGMGVRIDNLLATISTLQSDWATFQTSVQNDITNFENNVNTALSGMRSDITDFEADINAKISTQNAQIADMQRTVNAIPDNVNTAVDSKLAALTPPYSTVAIMWQAYHTYIGKQYQGITGNVVALICGTVPQAMQDSVELTLGITINRYVRTASYDDIMAAISDLTINNVVVVFIGNDFVGGQWPHYIACAAPMLVVMYGQAERVHDVGFVHALLVLSSATEFFMYDDNGLRLQRPTIFTSAGEFAIYHKCGAPNIFVSGNTNNTITVIPNMYVANPGPVILGYDVNTLSPATAEIHGYGTNSLRIGTMGKNIFIRQFFNLTF